MATTANYFTPTMLLFALLIATSLDFTVGQVGTFYGRLGTNLPSPAQTVSLYRQNNIRRMRLFDPHRPTLQSLNGTNIQLTMGVSHADLRDLANCPEAAASWVRRYILRFPNVTFRYIVVGNEIEPASELGPFVFPAMGNIFRAIRAAGLGGRIKVSTSIEISLLSTWNPPQKGEFKCSVNWFIRPILEFLRETRAPMFVNVFPFYAYINDRKNINLSFALLQPNSGVVLGGVYYDNLFYVILDAFYAAMDRILAAASPLSVDPVEGSSDETPPVNAKVTGGSIPTDDGGTGSIIEALSDGPANTVQNARTYINNLMRIVRTGTPRRPGEAIETFIFAMFDENLRPGPGYERHFGIFLASGQPKFPFTFR